MAAKCKSQLRRNYRIFKMQILPTNVCYPLLLVLLTFTTPVFPAAERMMMIEPCCPFLTEVLNTVVFAGHVS